jgi:hypothetical protein
MSQHPFLEAAPARDRLTADEPAVGNPPAMHRSSRMRGRRWVRPGSPMAPERPDRDATGVIRGIAVSLRDPAAVIPEDAVVFGGVLSLAEYPSARSACTGARIGTAALPAPERAVATLAESQMIMMRPTS